MMNLTSPENLGLSSSRLAYILPHLESYVDEGKLPGFQILVARRGQPAFFHQ